MPTSQEHQLNKMTNGQNEINEYLNKHFHEEFDYNYLSRFDNQEEAKEIFETDFEYRYNGAGTLDGSNLDLCLIRSKCDFLTTMKICEFVVDTYEDCGQAAEKNDFEEGGEILLKMYAYFYLRNKCYDFMINEIIPEHPYEEQEPDPEIPPAQ